MYKSTTTIESTHAVKYLTTLCRHFARKVEAKWDEEMGQVQFPIGNCEMFVNAEKDQLIINCSADSLEKLNGVEGVIEGHLQMFSRRETLQVSWKA